MQLVPFLVALLALLPGADSFEQAKAKLGKKTADDLCSIAKWCDGKEYFLERDRLYGLALVYSPDHRKARAALGYAKDGKGGWKLIKEPAPSRNHGRVDFEALQKKESRLWERWAKLMVSLIDKHADELGEERRRAELRAVLARVPDDEGVRRALGYVEGWEGHRWVLPSSKRSHARRLELKAAAARALKGVKGPQESALLDYERETGIVWGSHLESEVARVVNVGAKKESERALALIAAAPPFLEAALSVEPASLPPGFTAYLVDGQADMQKLLEKVPGTSGPRVKGVSSYWASGSDLFVGNGSKAGRLDMVSTQTVHHLLGMTFGIRPDQGWAWEGFGIYLSYKLCGTRLSFSVQPSEYEGDKPNTQNRLRESGANWLALAHEVLTRDKPPGLVFILGKSVNQLTGDDLLVGYALAAYLMEVHPGKVSRILSRLGREPAATVLEEELRIALPAIRQELVDWLADVK